MWIRGMLMAWVFIGKLLAADNPSWATRNAVDKLVAPHVLMLPGGDWFSVAGKATDQYNLPTKKFSRSTDGWLVELTSTRYRTFTSGQWGEWKEAQPAHTAWLLGVIRVTPQPNGGVIAEWMAGGRLISQRRAPSEIDARRLLASGTYAGSTAPKPPATTPPLVPPTDNIRGSSASPSTVPESERGIFKKTKDGKLERVQ